MALTETASTLAFTERRERMTKESMSVAEQLRLLQSDPSHQAQAPGATSDGSILPHFQHTSVSYLEGFHGANLASSRSAISASIATGLAAAFIYAKCAAASTIAAPNMGAPRPEEAGQK